MTNRREPKIPLYTAWPYRPATVYRGLYVGSLGHVRWKVASVRARFAAPAVGLIVAGTGTYAAGRRARVPVGPGSLLGVYPGPVFDYGPTDWWEEYYIGFAGPGAAELAGSGLIPRDGRVRLVADVPAAVRGFEEMLRLWQRARPGDADRVVLLGLRLLVDLYAAPPGVQSAAPADPVDAVLAVCRARPQDALDFEALAVRHGVSYSLLRQGIRRRTGLPPAKYLTRLRCEAACALLAAGREPVKRIARAVGIADPYAFSRTFRRTVGVSPQTYRDRQNAYG